MAIENTVGFVAQFTGISTVCETVYMQGWSQRLYWFSVTQSLRTSKDEHLTKLSQSESFPGIFKTGCKDQRSLFADDESQDVRLKSSQ